jgi:hypothetical protein
MAIDSSAMAVSTAGVAAKVAGSVKPHLRYRMLGRYRQQYMDVVKGIRSEESVVEILERL